MKKQHFFIRIRASREKVWNVLWDDDTYRQWTRPFSEGSRVVSDWEEGGEVQFIAADGTGIISTIASKEPNEFMSFKHIGILKEGIKQPMNEKTKEWTGAMENYTLKEFGGVTELSVDLETTQDHIDYFKETFPKALEKVRELCERESVQSK